MAKIKQFEAFTKNFVAYKKNWVYSHIDKQNHLWLNIRNFQLRLEL